MSRFFARARSRLSVLSLLWISSFSDSPSLVTCTAPSPRSPITEKTPVAPLFDLTERPAMANRGAAIPTAVA